MQSQWIVLALIGTTALLFSSKIRGIRNNNLLNIKHNPRNQWVGMIGVDNKGYVKFSDPIYSLRAAFRLLNTYDTLGVNNLWDILHRFAPPFENPTKQYISFVSQKTGIPPLKKLSRSEWAPVIQQMAAFETGETPPLSLVVNAQKMADI